MTERPILFSGPMVRALLAGRKTQTRRVVKWKPHEPGYNLTFSGMSVGHHCTGVPSSGWVLYSRGLGGCWNERTKPLHCPYGQPGDRLWVRENGWERPERTPHQMREGADTWERFYYDAEVGEADHEQFKAWGFKRRPSIHMPRWACRLELEVSAVRVERLHAISEGDAIAEGIRIIGDEYENFPNDGPNKYTIDLGGYHYNQPTARQCYCGLWTTINGEASWNANPWVWVVEFARVASTDKA